MPEATNTRTSKALPFAQTGALPSLPVPSASVGTGLVHRDPGRDECPPPPRWHRTPGEHEGITREVMKSSLVSMSGVRRHARNLREVLDWRSCRTPGERQRGRSVLAWPHGWHGTNGIRAGIYQHPQRAEFGALSSVSLKLQAVERDQDFGWKMSPKSSPVWSKLLSEITNEDARKKSLEDAQQGRDKVWRTNEKVQTPSPTP